MRLLSKFFNILRSNIFKCKPVLELNVWLHFRCFKFKSNLLSHLNTNIGIKFMFLLIRKVSLYHDIFLKLKYVLEWNIWRHIRRAKFKSSAVKAHIRIFIIIVSHKKSRNRNQIRVFNKSVSICRDICCTFAMWYPPGFSPIQLIYEF